MVFILGLHAFTRDSAVAIVRAGTVVAAAQEERFTRKKHDGAFPRQALSSCLATLGIGADALAAVAVSSDDVAPFVSALHALYPTVDWAARVSGVDPSLCQAASAYFASPFDAAAVLVLDGGGTRAPTTAWRGADWTLTPLWALPAPHSLGLLSTAFTAYTGFKAHSGEYKLMGLAPYGTPRFLAPILDHVLHLQPDGTFRINEVYFDLEAAAGGVSAAFETLFGGPPRSPDAPLTQRHMDLAASAQAAVQEAILRLARAVAAQTGAAALCLGGSVALNCVANGAVWRDKAFETLWVQPAAGPSGGAVGAALALWSRHATSPRRRAGQDAMAGAALGPAFSQAEIEERLKALGAVFEPLDQDTLLARAVDALVAEKVVGWFQGPMEFGPRALGYRSLLADPRSPTLRQTLNLTVKHRENFRPFAPAVLAEDAADWFDIHDSPYMLLVADVAKRRRRPQAAEDAALAGLDRLQGVRSEIPAVTHVDGSARVQTVRREAHPRFHALLSAFKARTGCPVLVNTSFNVRGEPIVATPEDAFRCFMGTDIEVLVIGSCFLRKAAQDPTLRLAPAPAFEPD